MGLITKQFEKDLDVIFSTEEKDVTIVGRIPCSSIKDDLKKGGFKFPGTAELKGILPAKEYKDVVVHQNKNFVEALSNALKGKSDDKTITLKLVHHYTSGKVDHYIDNKKVTTISMPTTEVQNACDNLRNVLHVGI